MYNIAGEVWEDKEYLEEKLYLNKEYTPTASDHSIWYEGCFAKFSSMNYGEGICRVDNFYALQPNKILCNFQRMEDLKNFVDVPITDIDFDWTLPKIGYINLPNRAIRVSRLSIIPSPARYRRGFRADTLDYNDIYLENEDIIPWQAMYHGKDIINSIYNNVYKEYKESFLNILEANKQSIALSDDLCLYKSKTYNNIFLIYNRYPIGYYLKSKKVFKLLSSGLKYKLVELDIPHEVK